MKNKDQKSYGKSMFRRKKERKIGTPGCKITMMANTYQALLSLRHESRCFTCINTWIMNWLGRQEKFHTKKGELSSGIPPGLSAFMLGDRK